MNFHWKTILTVTLSLFSFATAAHAEPELSVLTLNGAQLPSAIGMANPEKRAKKLAETILSMNRLPDVICLQEMFTKAAKDILKKKLGQYYPYRVHDKNYPLVGVNSGLMILSRHPIQEQFRHTYPDYRGIENFAAKGLLGAQIEWNGKTVLVFTTHLQTGGKWWWLDPIDEGKSSTDEIKIGQAIEAYDFIQVIRAKVPHGYPILTGDFNIKSTSDLYKKVTHHFIRGRDTYAPECAAHPGTTWADRNSTKGNRIDYIWTFDPLIKGRSCISSLFTMEATDHLGVIGTFTFEKR